MTPIFAAGLVAFLLAMMVLISVRAAAGFVDPWLNPGMSDPVVSSENEFTWGPAGFNLITQITIDSTCVDAGATPTTTVRRGLTLGKITATGFYKNYDPTATDGSQFPVGFLNTARQMLSPQTGAAATRVGTMVYGGPIKVGNLYGFDEQARKVMSDRFIWDDFRQLLEGPQAVVAKTADYTVLSTDNGLTFSNQGAVGAVNFTLPTTLARGFRVRFYCEAGQTITVTAPANKLVAFNNATATSIAFSTSSEKIGGLFEIQVNADATKYLAIVYLGAETQTPTIA